MMQQRTLFLSKKDWLKNHKKSDFNLHISLFEFLNPRIRFIVIFMSQFFTKLTHEYIYYLFDLHI